MKVIDKNDDILELFASLNNHEVFTPPQIARDMLDLLPKEVWTNPQYKFLDPATKTGVFLREITFRLFEGLEGKGVITGYDGKEYNLNDNQERMNHILKNMVFGISTSELTGYMSRRTLYGVMKASNNKAESIINHLIYISDNNIKTKEEAERSFDTSIINDYYDERIFTKDDNYKNFEDEGNIFYPYQEVDSIKKELEQEGKDIFGIEDTYFPFIQENVKHKKIKEIKEGEMKFDVIIGNPPYVGKSATHQKMFNTGVDILKKNGIICFIQPASAYFNKKKFSKSEEQKMYDFISKYKTSVYILPPSIFRGAQVSTDISITLLEKEEKNLNKVEFIKYKNGKIYKDVELKNITMTEIDPNIYNNIRKKYFNLIEKQGSLFDISIKDINSSKIAASIASIRGNRDENSLKNDYFTFISKKDIERGKGTKHGIICKENEIKNVHSYLMTNFARFALTFYKFNTNNHRGELRGVPIVAFNRTWTDDELFNLIKLTKKEIDIINNYIPNWNHTGK